MAEQQHPEITVLLRKKFVSKFGDEEPVWPDSIYGKLCRAASHAKEFFSSGPSKQALRNHEYHTSIDELIYDSGGCIAGWEMKRITEDPSILSYKCTTENKANDLSYLKNRWINKFQHYDNLEITDNLDVSGEVMLDFDVS